MKQSFKQQFFALGDDLDFDLQIEAMLLESLSRVEAAKADAEEIQRSCEESFEIWDSVQDRKGL